MAMIIYYASGHSYREQLASLVQLTPFARLDLALLGAQDELQPFVRLITARLYSLVEFQPCARLSPAILSHQRE